MVGDEIVALPVLLGLAAEPSSDAAAICDGLVRRTDSPEMAPAVGRTRYISPALAAPFTTMDMPAATKGSAAVPVPVIVTAWPVVVSCKDQLAPSKSSL